MDQRLDKMEGPMAGYLRRERFRTWHTDGDSWTSLHGEQILKDLATNNTVPARHVFVFLRLKIGITTIG